MALSVGELVAMLRADTRGFDRPVDQAGRRFGRFADLLRRGVSAAGETFRNLGSRMNALTARHLPGLHSAVGRFRDGFMSADAAASAFSGRMGSLGGLARRALDPGIAGLGRFRDGFNSSAAAASAFSGRMGTLGGYARTAVNGVTSAASRIGPAFSAAAGAASAGISRMREGMGGMAAQASGLVAAVGIGAFASSVIGAASAIDNTSRVLTGLYGSAQSSGDMMERLRRISSNSPIEHRSFLKGAESLAYMGFEGEQAERILQNVGKSITAAGGDSSAMESATSAMLNMVNAGKVYSQDLQTISSTGVPIFSALAAHFGTTIENVRDMVSEGKVSIEDVMSSVENATGDTFAKTLAASDAVTKSMSNQWAIFKDNLIVGLGEQLAPVAARLGEKFAGLNESLESGLQRIPGIIATVGDAAERWGLVAALQNIGQRMTEIGEVAGPFLVGAITGLGIAFAGVVHAVSMFLDFISPLTDYLRENEEVARGLGIAFGLLTAPLLIAKIGMMGVGIAAGILGPAIKTLGVIWRVLSSTWMIGALKIAAGWLVAMGPIGWIGIAIAALVALIIYYWDDIKAWTISTWSAITEWISNAWNTIVSTVSGWIERVNQITVDGWNRVKEWTANAWNAVVEWVKNAWSRIVETVRSWIARANQFTVDGWNRAKEATSSAWSSLVSTISSWINRAIEWVRGIPGRVRSALGNIGSLLVNSGRALVDGFLNGIKNAWGKITRFVKDGMSKLRNLWPFSPAKEGPFSGSGYVTHSGKALTSDFAASLRKGMPGVIEEARRLTEAAHAELTPDLPAVRMAADLPGDSALSRDRDRDRDQRRRRDDRGRDRGPSAEEIAEAVRAGVHAGLDRARMRVDGRGVAQLVNTQNSRDRRLGGTRNPAPTGRR